MPCWGHFLNSSLYLSRMLWNVSDSNCLHGEISLRSLVIIAEEKYEAKNFSANCAHMVINHRGKELSYYLALPSTNKRKSWRWITSSETLFSLNVSQISKRFVKCAYGSSSWKPSNCHIYWTICTKFGFMSKLFASIGGWTMLEVAHSIFGLA